MDSQLSHDVFPGQTSVSRQIEYNMQPPRPCSSTTNRVLVNMVPVCQDGDCRSEDPCAGKGKSSFDWSRPLSYGYGSNYFVEDSTGGGFMLKIGTNWWKESPRPATAFFLQNWDCTM